MKQLAKADVEQQVSEYILFYNQNRLLECTLTRSK